MQKNKWFLYGFVVCLTAVTALVAGAQAAPGDEKVSVQKAPEVTVSVQKQVGVTMSVPQVPVAAAVTPSTVSAPVSPTADVADTNEPRISLEFKQPTDIRMVLRAIAQKAKINIVPAPEVTGEITIVLKDVTWRKAVEVISTTYGYGYENIGDNVIRVAANIQPPLEVKSFRLRFSSAKTVADTIRPLMSPRGTTNVDERTNTLIVRDISPVQMQLVPVIEALDVITSQVSIEAKIIEADQSTVDKLGLDWERKANPGAWLDGVAKFTNPPIGTASTETGLFSFAAMDARTMSLTLTALLTDSKTNILSEPNITTVDNNPATIKVIDKLPIPNYSFNAQTGSWEISGYEEKEYGITLKVTPQITPEDEKKQRYITLLVEPTVSEKNDDTSKGITFSGSVTGSIPAATEQTTSTRVIVKDGQTLVIAGLIKNKETNTVNKVPLLGDIPYVGKAFQHHDKKTTKVNLLIFITPKIVTTDDTSGTGKEYVQQNRANLSNDFVAMSLDKELESYLADVDKKIETDKTK